MSRAVKTNGYARRAEVPSIEGTKVRLCKGCEAWFAARPYEQRCDACVRPAERVKRSAVTAYVQPEKVEKAPLGKEMCMDMAWELAEQLDYPKGKPFLTHDVIARINKRNYDEGKQR